MISNWREIALPIALGITVVFVFLFASANTSRLHNQERNIHLGATREPQSADPASSFLEIVLEPSPLAQLSAGLVGIAPSIHMIRMAATRPLSNVNPIEHPARRRFGRIDFSFAFLVFLPIALIPLFYMIYKKCASQGDQEKLISGKISLFDFGVERILLPLFASGGLVFAVTIACLYSSGLRLNSNELLGRLSIWALLISLYLLCWILLFAFLLLRSASFSMATIKYAAIFLMLVIVMPQLIQSLELSIERPKGRLSLIVERRKLSAEIQPGDQAGIDAYFTRQGFGPLNWTEPLPKPQSIAIDALRVEEKFAPKLQDFDENVRKLDDMAIIGSWISPFLVAQFGVDDLAGTGLARYSRFRTASITYQEQWRKYTLGFLAKRQFLDFDALRNVPKFNGNGEDFTRIFLLGVSRCVYFGVIFSFLAIGIRRELSRILPKNIKAAR